MALPTRAFTGLLASPPLVRAEIFRFAVTRSLTTKAARENLTPKSHIYTGLRIPRTHTRQTRSQSSASTPNINSTPTGSPPPPPSSPVNGAPLPSRFRRFLFTSGLVVIFFSAGFLMAAAPVAEAANGLLNPPTDAETLTLFDPPTATSAEIDEYILNHPLSKKLRAQEGMTESRPHMKIPLAMRAHNLTGGTLMGEDKIAVPPLTFTEKEEALPTMVQISYLGPALCGHPGIVHGGLLATLLDEGLARACFPALPNKVGVTASLKIDYRRPCPADSYVVLKAQTTKVEGRKAWVKGWIELLGEEDGDGTIVVEAEALFIEPKQAKTMARAVSGT